jgi:hypothetical protein
MMRSNKTTKTARILFAFAVGLFFVAVANLCDAQATSAQSGGLLLATNNSSADVSTESGLANESPFASAQPESSGSAQSESSGKGSNWNVVIAPYVWFPGVHGTVGDLGRQLGVHATPADMLSHLRFGLMGAAEFRHNRFLLPLDLFWVRLGDNRAIPLEQGVISANMKGQQFILTPKVGYLLIDNKKLKATALAGFRYWHLGESLTFSPAVLGWSFSASQNWVDPVLGGRLEVAPAPKVVVTVLGDAGGWGTGSQSDYQFAGLLGYRITPRWTVHGGYRYMGVDYRSAGFVYNMIQSGAVFGMTIALR